MTAGRGQSLARAGAYAIRSTSGHPILPQHARGAWRLPGRDRALLTDCSFTNIDRVVTFGRSPRLCVVTGHPSANLDSASAIALSRSAAACW